MKAIVIHDKKDLRIEEREAQAPLANEVQVNITTGGVCGSDLHYYNHGGFGTIRLKEPMILGHEVAGKISSLGADVQGLQVGQLVAVSPSRPCFECKYCLEGKHNHCLNMRFYGSAMPMPHIQGAFRETINVLASQCIVADGLSSGEAAMAEPLSVTLHATKRAGQLLGKRVLVTGCGPIGALSIICARRAGATEIVATDLAANALAQAIIVGADRTINVADDASALDAYSKDKGYFDVLFECSGAEQALAMGIASLRPQGTIMQLGLSGDMSLPMMAITAKELNLKGSFRFHEEFNTAVELMRSNLIDVKPLITHTFDLADAEQAFITANDRSVAMKTQIAFSQ
ncbi:UNVERIFIED_CONTAM: hypothetical protein GTU68_032335 [Idotea baltica]|nr:hypothetical protein [Idotea baltica]